MVAASRRILPGNQMESPQFDTLHKPPADASFRGKANSAEAAAFARRDGHRKNNGSKAKTLQAGPVQPAGWLAAG
jgi:hypothetical protein